MLISEPAELVKQTRLSLGLTLSKFGTRLGVTGEYIRLIEAGEREISDEMLTKALRRATSQDDQQIVNFCLDAAALLYRNQLGAIARALSTIDSSMEGAGHVS